MAVILLTYNMYKILPNPIALALQNFFHVGKIVIGSILSPCNNISRIIILPMRRIGDKKGAGDISSYIYCMRCSLQ